MLQNARPGSLTSLGALVTLSGLMLIAGCPQGGPLSGSPLSPGLYVGQATSRMILAVGGQEQTQALPALPYQIRVSNNGLPLMRRTSGPEYAEGATDTVAFGTLSIVISVTDVSSTSDTMLVAFTARATFQGTALAGVGTERYQQLADGSLVHNSTMTLLDSGGNFEMTLELSGNLR